MTALAALAYECEMEGWQRGAWGHWVRYLFATFAPWWEVQAWHRANGT